MVGRDCTDDPKTGGSKVETCRNLAGFGNSASVRKKIPGSYTKTWVGLRVEAGRGETDDRGGADSATREPFASEAQCAWVFIKGSFIVVL